MFLGRASLEDAPHVHAVEAKFTTRSVIPQVPVMAEELELALASYLHVHNDGEVSRFMSVPSALIGGE